MNSTTLKRSVVAVALALAMAPALAVDPALHTDPAEPGLLPLTGSPPGMPFDMDGASGVAVQEIRDLGARGDAAADAGDLWQRMRRGFAIADLDGPIVVERQAWYSQRPQSLAIMVERSRRYLFHIVEELEKRGMPTEIALLPMVESAFNPMAYSRAHASGLWQFIPSTGRNYNLDQNWWYDARRDILASTNAALDYLQTLHQMFGDWHLALAAYNMGENGVARAIERNRARGLPTDYASLQMPNETRRYVPSLQALKNIVANPKAAGIELEAIPNAPYFVTVTLNRDIDLKVAARLAGMTVEEFVALNPAHNRPMVSSAVAPQIVLPADRAELFAQNLESNGNPLSSWRVHTVKTGDRIEKLAAESGVSVERLRAVNGLRGNAVAQGQQLLVPQRGSPAATEPLPPIFTPPAAGRIVEYTVRNGDSLARIAKAVGTSVAAVRSANGGDRLVAGRKLVINAPVTVAVRKAPARAAATKQAKPATRAAKTAPARPAAPTQIARRSSPS